MNLKLKKKLVHSSVALAMGATFILPSISASAAEKAETQVTLGQQQPKAGFQSYTPTRAELQGLGLSDTEITQLLNTPSSGIMLYQGKVIKNGQHGQVQGKLGWAVKALKAAYNKVPASVKKSIGGVAAFEKLLGYIDHYTGAVEDAIYDGLIYIGVNKTAAWWITKTLTALAF
ncbi:hypothetical protein AT267_00895 [Bacillus cereus]|nr:hypothetical protein [Bacillus cereus]KXY10988.1 hypothetical protein AT267_00895 [Bacillus cereus]